VLLRPENTGLTDFKFPQVCELGLPPGSRSLCTLLLRVIACGHHAGRRHRVDTTLHKTKIFIDTGLH